MPRKPESVPEKYCERCGVLLERKRYNGVLEDKAAFMRRKFCSLHCANLRGNWGKSLTARYRVSTRKRMPQCERCGMVPPDLKQLHVHHKNEDITDNRVKNLETLCASCHKLEHHRRKRV